MIFKITEFNEMGYVTYDMEFDSQEDADTYCHREMCETGFSHIAKERTDD